MEVRGGVLVAALFCAGCAGVRTKGEGALETIVLGKSVRGTSIEAHVLPGRSPGILVIGGIHGDEAVGTALVEAFEARLRAEPSIANGRRVVLLPRANPDGLAAGTRWNAHGIDVNRNFPAPNFSADARHGKAACSEPESRAIVELLAAQRFALVISIHAPLRCVDYDGDAARPIAEKLAAESKLPLRHLGGLPGSLGTYAGLHLGLRMVTYELDRRRAPRANAAAYLAPHVEALRVAVRTAADVE
jgi:murein peptide amidase A